MTRRDFLARLLALLLTWRLPGTLTAEAVPENLPPIRERGGMITVPLFVGAPDTAVQEPPPAHRVFWPVVRLDDE